MIKPITYQDRKNILALLKATAVFNQSEIAVAMELIDLALAEKDNGDYRTFAYHDDDNRFRGYICFGPIPMTDCRYDLYWIAVDRKARGKGIADELVAFMERQVARNGGGKIYVDTASTPPYGAARGFYEKQRYSPVCVLDDFYRKGDSKIIFMKDIEASN